MTKRIRIFFILLFVAILALVGWNRYQKYKEDQIKAKIQGYRTRITELSNHCRSILNEGYADLFKDDQYFESAEVTIAHLDYSGHLKDSIDGDSTTHYCRLNIYLQNSFDGLTNDKKYELIEMYYKKAVEGQETILYDKLPELGEIEEELKAFTEETFGDEFKIGGDFYTYQDFKCFILTDQNKYERSSYYSDDYFLVNGKEVYTQKHWDKYNKKKPTPTPTAEPKKKKSSSGKGKKIIYNGSKDPYEVDEYDDPDDFWEDHEDEFEDFEDAWDYWEENR